MLAPALALGSSLSGGGADFVGGVVARRVGAVSSVYWTQLLGVALAGLWVAISGQGVPSFMTLATGAGAGLSLTVCLGAMFKAMAIGSMSIVAPISATGVIVPIIVALLEGERPSAAQTVGIVIAISGVALAGRGQTDPTHHASATSGVGLALVAACGQGLFFWLMAVASRSGVAWALLDARTVPLLVLLPLVILSRGSLRAAFRISGSRLIVANTILGFAAIGLYGLASNAGDLAPVAVLSALYPAVTVALAHWRLGERLRGEQRIGMVAVLVGVVLMATT